MEAGSRTMTTGRSRAGGRWLAAMVVLVIASLGTLVESKDVSAANGGTNGLTATAGQWRATGSVCLFRVLQTATLLSTGEVLVTGGFNQGAPPPYCDPSANPAELYNPATGQWITSGAAAPEFSCWSRFPHRDRQWHPKRCSIGDRRRCDARTCKKPLAFGIGFLPRQSRKR
jgi:hypothetical protein